MENNSILVGSKAITEYLKINRKTLNLWMEKYNFPVMRMGASQNATLITSIRLIDNFLEANIKKKD
jgi:hypothetical protein